jgi:hypothetical protein
MCVVERKIAVNEGMFHISQSSESLSKDLNNNQNNNSKTTMNNET